MSDAVNRPRTEEGWQARIYDALFLFSPGAPIGEPNLLAGRTDQIDKMIESVMQRGRHAILYGERGVGKSSLANTFSARLLGGARSLYCIPINCHPTDDFSEIWRKVFRRLAVDGEDLSSRYPDQIYPNDVVYEFVGFSLNIIPIIILDEFDKLRDENARMLIANTIKNLSDRSTGATVVIVGVADSVTSLIEDHESVSRCLKQIKIQRMFPSELRQIINRRLPELGMEIQPDALAHIVALARGLPHYAHLLGQRSSKRALENKSLTIDMNHVAEALPECIEETDRTIREQYHEATISPRKGNIYREVLLAAGLARVDELGYFAPADLQGPLSALLESEVKVSLFGQHLKRLCQEDRGGILERVGAERRYRYRFKEPMTQPFILMHGLRNGLISQTQVNELAATHYEPRLSGDF